MASEEVLKAARELRGYLKGLRNTSYGYLYEYTNCLGMHKDLHDRLEIELMAVGLRGQVVKAHTLVDMLDELLSKEDEPEEVVEVEQTHAFLLDTLNEDVFWNYVHEWVLSDSPHLDQYLGITEEQLTLIVDELNRRRNDFGDDYEDMVNWIRK